MSGKRRRMNSAAERTMQRTIAVRPAPRPAEPSGLLGLMRTFETNYAVRRHYSDEEARRAAALGKDLFGACAMANAASKPEEYLEIVRKEPWALAAVPEDKRTPAMELEAYRKDPAVFRWMSEKAKTKEVCLDAFRRDPGSVKYMPEGFATEDMYGIAMAKCRDLPLSAVPRRYRTPSICAMAVQNDPRSFLDVPLENQTFSMYSSAMRRADDRLRQELDAAAPQEFQHRFLNMSLMEEVGEWKPPSQMRNADAEAHLFAAADGASARHAAEEAQEAGLSQSA